MLSRVLEFREKLTVVHQPASSLPFRVVRSSGGAAGGIVSEGQGYGLLLAGVSLASQPAGSPAWRATLSFGEELFAGWRRMCELSKSACQDEARMRCGGRRSVAAGGQSVGCSQFIRCSLDAPGTGDILSPRDRPWRRP